MHNELDPKGLQNLDTQRAPLASLTQVPPSAAHLIALHSASISSWPLHSDLHLPFLLQTAKPSTVKQLSPAAQGFFVISPVAEQVY